jgi:hypothetical protein
LTHKWRNDGKDGIKERWLIVQMSCFKAHWQRVLKQDKKVYKTLQMKQNFCDVHPERTFNCEERNQKFYSFVTLFRDQNIQGQTQFYKHLILYTFVRLKDTQYCGQYRIAHASI